MSAAAANVAGRMVALVIQLYGSKTYVRSRLTHVVAVLPSSVLSQHFDIRCPTILKYSRRFRAPENCTNDLSRLRKNKQQLGEVAHST